MRNKKINLTFIFSAVFLILSNVNAQKAAPKFGFYSKESKSGYLRIIWTGTEESDTFELEQSNDSAFQDAGLIYRGPDLATFVSGLSNGIYYFRVRSINGAWSKPLVVNVKHHSLAMAFALFGIGAVVFVLTAGLVIIGERRVVEDQDEHG